MIPGEDLQLPEGDLLTNIGKYISLYEHEQRKRIILVQAYNELQAELNTLKESLQPPLMTSDDVVIGNP